MSWRTALFRFTPLVAAIRSSFSMRAWGSQNEITRPVLERSA